MSLNRYLVSLVRRASVFAMLAFAVAAPVCAAGPYGDCYVLFVEGKAPQAPNAVTPLCEKRDDAVYFATGYSKRDNYGYWSAYRLDEEQIDEIDQLGLPRPNVQFKQNPKLKVGSYVQPRHDSYTGTGWDRGHVAPNGAMAWDAEAQRASFTVSNIAPQNSAMNRNIWRCFEISIREWAASSSTTFVVVGTVRSATTIFSTRDPHQVKINVPTHYIAMVYREKPSPMAIGVMVPNSAGHLDVRQFIMSVHDLEQKTGYRFQLPSAVSENAPDFAQWPTRILDHEIFGKPPDADVQCPHAPLP
jgi:DNA/RNA endonuclease G (NUC1)